MAGGAAALGFLANDLWKEYKQQEQPNCSGSRQYQQPSTSSWESTPRSRMESRKQNRDDDKSEEVLAGQKCIVCFDNPREVLLEPCNHVCLCENCAERIGSFCPLCRKGISNKKAIFL